MIHTGRHFLQIPGPTNCPDRILRAMDRPVIDHRGPEFAELCFEILEGIRPIFKTSGPVIMYPGSGTGAWEAAIVNTLSPGDRVVMFEVGHFAHLWQIMAQKLRLEVDYVPGNWRRGTDLQQLEARLDALDRRLDNIDSMVTAVAERVMNRPLVIVATCPHCGKNMEIALMGTQKPAK